MNPRACRGALRTGLTEPRERLTGIALLARGPRRQEASDPVSCTIAGFIRAIGKGLQSAVRVMDDDDLGRTGESLEDDGRADCIITGDTS